MKAFRMEWVRPSDGHVRVTIDCGINDCHAEAGSRALLPGYKLVAKQPLGNVSGPDELRHLYGQAMGKTHPSGSHGQTAKGGQ